jgi:hypothetical protein
MSYQVQGSTEGIVQPQEVPLIWSTMDEHLQKKEIELTSICHAWSSLSVLMTKCHEHWLQAARERRWLAITNQSQIKREINIAGIAMVEDQSCYRWWPSNKQWRVIVQCVTSQVTKKGAIIKMALRNKESHHEVISGESGWQRKCPALMMMQQEATTIRPIITLAVIINDIRREDQS